MLRPQADQVRELMGAANPISTMERKAASKAAKASYGAELQAQMRANEEAKQREREERRGIVRPPVLQAPPPPGLPYGIPSPGGGGMDGQAGGGVAGYGNPQAYAPQPAYSPTGPSAMGAPGAAAPTAPWNYPPYQPGGPAPPAQQPYQQPQQPYQQPYQPSAAGPPPMGGPFGMPSPGYSAAPPPMYMQPGGAANGGYGPPPPLGYSGGYGAPAGNPAAPPPPPLLPGPAPPGGVGPNTMRRMEQQARKDQYRLELEAQIRDREERKAAEKAHQRAEDMRKEAEMAAYAMNGGGMGGMGGGRGGGGAPLRDAGGNVVANLGQMNRMGGGMMGPPQGQGSPGRMGGMGMGGPQDYGLGPMGGPPPPGMGGMGMGGMPSPGGMGGPPMGPMGGPPMMGGGPAEGGPGGVMPNFRFRSDNAYLTPGELDNKQRQARELQEALEQQIQEKKRAKELEKELEKKAIAKEEARFQANAGPQAANAAAEGGDRSEPKVVVVDAWEKARLEAEEAKRNKFAAKRGAAAATPAAPGGGEGGPWGDGPFGGGGNGGYAPNLPPPLPPQPPLPPPPLLPPDPLMPLGGGGPLLGAFSPPPVGPAAGGGSIPTPLVVEKVRQVAAAELAAVKQELAAEAAQLREVVAAQGQQVEALKSHAERLEAEAERARGQVAAMRVGILQRVASAAAPRPAAAAEEADPLLRALADYGSMAAGPPPPPPPPPALVDIGLELPPTAVELRRQAGPPPVFDMGPLIPQVNNAALMMDNVAASNMNSSAAAAAAANGGGAAGPGNGRPLTSGLRTINPLEASMAAESVFIFPNGREMGRYTNAAAVRGSQPAAAPAAIATATDGPSSGGGGALPFQSVHMAAGVGSSGGGIPMVATTQELETGPVPQTPLDRSVAASQAGGLAGGLAAGTLAAAAAALEPPSGGALLRQGSGRRRSGAAFAPIDMDMMMSRNQDKLAMLKGMTELPDGATSIEALDQFLSRYAAQRPGLPERTATPVLRIPTPNQETIQHPGAALAETPFAAYPFAPPAAAVAGPSTVTQAATQSTDQSKSRPPSQPGGSQPPSQPNGQVPIYSTRANSVGPLPMGAGRVLSGGGSGNGRPVGSLPGTPDKAGTLTMARRNSFTGDRAPREGVLSQHFAPLVSGSRPNSGVSGPLGGTASGGGGLRTASPRPPVLANTRYSSSGREISEGAANGSAIGNGNGASSMGGAAGRTEGGSRVGSAVGGRPPAAPASSRPASGVRASGDTDRGTSQRSARAPSIDFDTDSLADSAAFPSYAPSLEGSLGPGLLPVSRSRSLTAASSMGGGRLGPGGGSGAPPAAVLKPPSEDTLDTEMRKGLGTAGRSSRPSSQAGGQRPGGEGAAAEPQFQIPRSPLLSGSGRLGSASSQRGVVGLSGAGAGLAAPNRLEVS